MIQEELVSAAQSATKVTIEEIFSNVPFMTLFFASDFASKGAQDHLQHKETQ